MSPALKEFFVSVGEQGRQLGGNVAQNHVEKLNRNIIAAGEPGDMTGLQLFGIQIVCAVIFPIFWGFIFHKISFLSDFVEGPLHVPQALKKLRNDRLERLFLSRKYQDQRDFVLQ